MAKLNPESVDKAAAAIYGVRCRDNPELGLAFTEWERLDEHDRADFREQATAALLAVGFEEPGRVLR